MTGWKNPIIFEKLSVKLFTFMPEVLSYVAR